MTIVDTIQKNRNGIIDALKIGLLVLCIYSILLLPASEIIGSNEPLYRQEQSLSSQTPFKADEFIFYWSPIDPLYIQAGQHRNWYYTFGYSDNNDRSDQAWGNVRVANLNQDDLEPYGIYGGLSFYAESFIWDEGCIAIGSYDENNHVELWMLNGHIINNIVPDKIVNITGHRGDEPVGPELVKVTSPVKLWEGTLSKYGGILLNTSDIGLYGGTVKVKSTGQISVQTFTVTGGYIDWNGNGIPDPLDTDPENNNDEEVAHGIDTAWFANGLSDDAIWSWFGTDLVAFIHRDLCISAYDQNTVVHIEDLSDGDDTTTVSLNTWENYIHAAEYVAGYCDNDNDNNAGAEFNNLNISEPEDYEIMQKAIDSGNFEADWVHIKSNNPITIVAGLFDNNLHTQVFGQIGMRYYIPVPTGLEITGLHPNTHFSVDWDYSTAYDVHSVPLAPGETVQYKTMLSRSQSNNYVMEAAWCRIIATKPIRVQIWQANDDNAFDMAQLATYHEWLDYTPLDTEWHLHLHHRGIVYITAMEEGETHVGWTGDHLEGQPMHDYLDQYETFRIVIDEYEDYDGDGNDDVDADNEEELEKNGAGVYISIEADKDVQCLVRYAADYSCEPQDAAMILTHKPTIHSSTSDPITLIPPFIACLLVADVSLVVVTGISPLSSLLRRRK
ncbi:MAG: hypothetical protein ACFFCZ_03590 [Promethearchaeota archaeon]